VADYSIASLRNHKTAAHVVPLVVFLGLGALAPAFRIDHPDLPWWRSNPEHWVYPLQTLVALALLAFWWRQYDFRLRAVGAAAIGIAAGVIGIAVWILPNWLSLRTGIEVRWLGVLPRPGPGFNPEVFSADAGAWWTAVGLRFLRLVVAVPIIEEIFWRDFLWRYLSHPDRPWWQSPFGEPKARAWIGSSLLMVVAHQPADWAVCFLWALLAGWVAVKTRSLAACIICHATSNLILGFYILASRQWGLW
jgi:CAAX prenyl protease-like protein